MTILRRVARSGFVWALVGSLLVATGRGNEDSTPARRTTDEPAKDDRTAVLKEIDVAIAKAVDPNVKRALVTMRRA